MLAEHGHQFATIKTDVKTIPPASVQINFNIKEGPVVKVGKIKFAGNQHISCSVSAPVDEEPEAHRHSLLDHLRRYLPADLRLPRSSKKTPSACARPTATRATPTRPLKQPKTQIRDEGGLNWFTFRPNKGKRIDILLPIEEGGRYRLGAITFTGNKADQEREGPARHVPHQGWRLVQRYRRSEGSGQPEEGLRQPGLHQLRRHSASSSTTTRRRPSR